MLISTLNYQLSSLSAHFSYPHVFVYINFLCLHGSQLVTCSYTLCFRSHLHTMARQFFRAGLAASTRNAFNESSTKVSEVLHSNQITSNTSHKSNINTTTYLASNTIHSMCRIKTGTLQRVLS